MHKNINFNLFSVSVSTETRMEAEIRFRFCLGHKTCFGWSLIFSKRTKIKEDDGLSNTP